MIGGKDFSGLDKRNSAVLAALPFRRFHLVFANDLSDRLLNIALMELVLARLGTHDRHVVIATLTKVKKSWLAR